MIKNIFWLLLGATLGVASYHVIMQYPSLKIDSNLVVNIVIAIAACIATFLTSKQIDIQRQDRIWDMNKPILLELMHLLTEVIEEDENSLNDYYHTLSNPDHESPERQSNSKVYDNLNRKINNLLSVYKPILDEDLIKELKEYKEICSKIIQEFNNDDFGEFDPIAAYETQLESGKKLYTKLSDLISNIAGI